MIVFLTKYSKAIFKYLIISFISCVFFSLMFIKIVFAVNTDPPVETKKLFFLHASIGEAWLGNSFGTLGATLGANNYFVSDWNTNTHGTPPDHNLYQFYTILESYLATFKTYYIQEAVYTQIADPGGENDIIMIKPCGINWQGMTGNVGDPPSGVDPHSAANTVGDTKQVLLDTLTDITSANPDTLFVWVIPPACPTGIGCIDGAVSRHLADWMMNDMFAVAGYTVGNVLVWDLYNVLTSNSEGEGDTCGVNDIGLATGNHHRVYNNAVQHVQGYDYDYTAYCAGHPSVAGALKATAEFVPVLNAFINNGTITGPPAAPQNLRILVLTP
jgi:hypothetical protein